MIETTITSAHVDAHVARLTQFQREYKTLVGPYDFVRPCPKGAPDWGQVLVSQFAHEVGEEKKVVDDLRRSEQKRRLARSTKEHEKQVRARRELLDRIQELLGPATEELFLAALMWIAERGGDQHLELLGRIREKPRFPSRQAKSLVDLGEKSIIERCAADCVSAIRSQDSTPQEKLQQAQRLEGFGVRLRGSSEARGSLVGAAANLADCWRRRLRRPREAMVTLVSLVADPRSPARLRDRLAGAIGEWGGAGEARILAALLASEKNEDLAIAWIAALGNIGGFDASEALCRALSDPSERVRLAALQRLEELATSPAAYSKRDPSPEDRILLQRVAGTVKRISEDSLQSPTVRCRAEELLPYVTLDVASLTSR